VRIFGDERIKVRQLRDRAEDYALFAKWLSDLDVCEYYEGRSKPFDYDMVLEKFQERARGVDPVIVGIIEYDGIAIGWVQYYIAEPGEYEELDAVDISKYEKRYGIDIVIGVPAFWNKGIGTRVMALLNEYLFEHEKADMILIAPQAWNKRAIRCYEKAGFRQVKIIKDMELHDDELVDGVLMVKECLL
jgi:aminoglycoside 6'-N-acetyltransferase